MYFFFISSPFFSFVEVPFCDVIIRCLGRAVFHDCGLFWVSLYLFFNFIEVRSIVQLIAYLTADPGVTSLKVIFVDIDHEMLIWVILSFLLIQEGQFSFLVTIDITAFYTNIPNNEGMQHITHLSLDSLRNLKLGNFDICTHPIHNLFQVLGTS